MKQKCSVCITPTHTEKFDRIYAAIIDELKKRNIRGTEDPDELAKALSYWSPTHWRSIFTNDARSAQFVAG